MIPHGSPISGDGLARGYDAGFFVYPTVNVWEVVGGESDSSEKAYL